MPTLSAGDVVRVSVRLSMPQGQDHVNVYFFECQGAEASTDTVFAGDVNDFIDQIYSRWNAGMSNAVTPVDMKIDVVDFVGGVLTITENIGLFPFVASSFNPVNGGDVLPPQDAAVVKLLTGQGRVFGRKFIGALCEDQQNSGVPAAALITQAGTFITDMLAGWTSTGTVDFVAGVMSEKFDAFVPFIAGELASAIGNQVRRKLNVGS
jgi:hypothetical protein